MSALSTSEADGLTGLVARFDPELFWPMRESDRVRLIGDVGGPRDVVFGGDRAFLVAPGARADATLSADPATWGKIADDPRGGLDAFGVGTLAIRRDLHLGVGFLAAIAQSGPNPTHPGAWLRFAQVQTAAGELSIDEAGSGPAVVLLHGLGATKASMLTTLDALARAGRRAIALDLPGFGDSVKPIRAAYDAAYFAKAVVALLDALGIARADIVGNSLGGRVALELGLAHPERIGRLALLAPSLAWLRGGPWAPLLRLAAPRLGLPAPAPRPLIEAVARRLVPGASEQWRAAGIDEFLRSYETPRGQAAFLAAARNLYLESPDGLWTRLSRLEVPALFVWGRRDRLVPIGSASRVRDALPGSEHLEIECGHVPQLESPTVVHPAIAEYLDRA